MKNNIIRYYSILLIIVLVPLFLYYIIPILPTHDDWASTTRPDFNPFFIKERFLFYGYHWRPFDAILGYIVGRNPQHLYPIFNHCIIILGHVLCACLIFRLLSVLKFSKHAINITTIYFFIAPATMATVTAVDSMNQTYALVCGIIAFLVYIQLNKGKYLAWICIIFVAAWFKENGLMWALICPILAYGFDFINVRTLKKDLLIGFAVMVSYALIIFLLPKEIIIHPEYVPDILKMIKNVVKFIFTTFITVDYIYLLHEPNRNLLAAVFTFILSLPLLYLLFIKNARHFFSKKMICTILCLLIAVAPHVGTIFSMMHTYAGMAMLAIMIAFAIDKYKDHLKPIYISFLLFCLSAIIIDHHLIKSSVASGIVGKMMAIEAIQKTEKPVDSVFVVIIEDDYPKLSSFCVIPNDAFGWGLASQYETNYQWPKVVEDTIIERSDESLKQAQQICFEALNKKKYDCVWIINGKDIDVVR